MPEPSAPTIGVDVGGTKIAGAVVSPSGEVVARHLLPTEANEPKAIVTAVVKIVRELQGAAAKASAVGIGAAGLVDSERGIILGAPNLAWRDLPLRDEVSAKTRLPVAVENDANVAAWGEALYGAGRGVADQVMVTVGTGIGSGLVLAGRLYRGAHGLGAELGHMVLDPEGPACGCGNRGCWEALASGNAIGRIARDRAAEALDSKVMALAGGDSSAITGELVGKAAFDGDDFARSVLAEAGRWLGVGLANVVNIFDPELVVVGGGAGSALGEHLLAPARAAMAEHVLGTAWRPPVRLVPAELGQAAGVVGAAALARQLVR